MVSRVPFLSSISPPLICYYIVYKADIYHNIAFILFLSNHTNLWFHLFSVFRFWEYCYVNLIIWLATKHGELDIWAEKNRSFWIYCYFNCLTIWTDTANWNRAIWVETCNFQSLVQNYWLLIIFMKRTRFFNGSNVIICGKIIGRLVVIFKIRVLVLNRLHYLVQLRHLERRLQHLVHFRSEQLLLVILTNFF